MRIAGIVCEYNPFHMGHRKQILETHRILGADTGVLCLMSGNYVQRGEPALYDKWTRAEMAIRGGADLVLELPLTAAVDSAGGFAEKAVSCLDALGGIEYLSFGSETGDIKALQKAADIMDTPEYEGVIREKLTLGISYAAARQQALEALGGQGGLLLGANNALGLGYMSTLHKLGSSIKPLTITRDMTLASASVIREGITGEEKYSGLPDTSETLCRGAVEHRMEYGERAVLSVLRRMGEAEFEALPFGSEGLWSLFMKCSRRENTLENVLMGCKSKRYAFARLRRMALCAFLGLTKTDMEREIPYLRVLAFNDRGRGLLRELKETSRLPLLSGQTPKGEREEAYFDLELRATDLYGLFAPPGILEALERERSHPPIYIREGESVC